MVDPRLKAINHKLAKVGRLIAVSSGKGGVGKSMVASTLALTLQRRGFSVGLLDLDFSSPSTHLILGIEGVSPREEKGIVPPLVKGIKYMSITYYSGDLPTPLRGAEITDAIIELLAITRWEDLDYLLIDMPPGIGDATLDLIRLVDDIAFLIVTTPSQVAFETVRKLIQLLRALEVPIIGVIENMKMTDSSFIRESVKSRGLVYLGEVAFDPGLEEALGNVDRLLETRFGKNLSKLSHWSKIL